MRYRIVLLVAAAAVLAQPAEAGEALDFRVVIHADNPASSVSREELARLFLLQERHWQDGTPNLPIDQLAGSEVREAFSRTVHGKSTAAIQSYWQRQGFRGEATPPAEVGSDAEVLAFVELEPGAVGYVASGAYLPPSIRVLEVTDLRDADPAAPPATRAARASRRDETLGSHGDLRLFLTGACGPGGAGRYAVLANRSPYDPLTAVIETSEWDGGRLRSSSSSRHTVRPLEEQRLGCTRRSGDFERRYTIVEASSASSHRLERHPDRPARSVIAIVDAGTCGQRRAGRWRAVVNRHPRYEVRVAIEVRELADGKVRRRYRKTDRLAPGAAKRLGCSADGPITRQFTVLEAQYR